MEVLQDLPLGCELDHEKVPCIIKFSLVVIYLKCVLDNIDYHNEWRMTLLVRFIDELEEGESFGTHVL